VQAEDSVRDLLAIPASRVRSDYLHRLGIYQRDDRGPRSFVSKSSAVSSDFDGEAPEAGEDLTPDSKPMPDPFRLRFLKKLSYSRVWLPMPQRPPKHQTLVIFDWDDTLLCTTYLTMGKPGLYQAAADTLKSIGGFVRKLLEQAAQLGHTFIITNATQGWVEQSAADYMPEVLPALEAVRVISARSEYEPAYPGEVAMWKLQAFLQIQRQLGDDQAITNVVSVGDSDFESDAAQAMSRQCARALLKTVRFAQRPTPQDLERQLELVGKKFRRIVEAGRDLQVSLGRRPRSTP
jgi:hypothetical protein